MTVSARLKRIGFNATCEHLVSVEFASSVSWSALSNQTQIYTLPFLLFRSVCGLDVVTWLVARTSYLDHLCLFRWNFFLGYWSNIKISYTELHMFANIMWILIGGSMCARTRTIFSVHWQQSSFVINNCLFTCITAWERTRLLITKTNLTSNKSNIKLYIFDCFSNWLPTVSSKLQFNFVVTSLVLTAINRSSKLRSSHK